MVLQAKEKDKTVQQLLPNPQTKDIRKMDNSIDGLKLTVSGDNNDDEIVVITVYPARKRRYAESV